MDSKERLEGLKRELADLTQEAKQLTLMQRSELYSVAMHGLRETRGGAYCRRAEDSPSRG